MRGSQIIVTADPEGTRDEGTLDITAHPGTLVELVPNTTDLGGRTHFRPITRAAGTHGPIAVLLDDPWQGFIPGTPSTGAMGSLIAAAQRCFVYWPRLGDDLNIVVADGPGTGLAVTEGDLFGVGNVATAGGLSATGEGVALHNSSYAATPFQAREALAALSAATLCWMKFLGSAG